MANENRLNLISKNAKPPYTELLISPDGNVSYRDSEQVIKDIQAKLPYISKAAAHFKRSPLTEEEWLELAKELLDEMEPGSAAQSHAKFKNIKSADARKMIADVVRRNSSVKNTNKLIHILFGITEIDDLIRAANAYNKNNDGSVDKLRTELDDLEKLTLKEYKPPNRMTPIEEF